MANFTDLPYELREQIWTLAIRTHRRGAHWFDLYSMKDGVKPRDARYMMNASGLSDDCRLAAPTNIKPYSVNSYLEVHGIHYNSSAYWIDAGLWTTCKESRFIMQHYFNNRQQKLVRGSKDRLKTGQSKTPATGYFYNEDSEPRFWTVVPDQDLFIIQPHDMSTIRWQWLGFQDLNMTSAQAQPAIQNFGFVYQPEWHEQFEQAYPFLQDSDIFQTLLGIFEELPPSCNIWLIDYSIKKIPYVCNESESRIPAPEPFYAADRQFERVTYGCNTLRPGWEKDTCDGRSFFRGSIDLADQLQEQLREDTKANPEWDSDSGWDPCYVNVMGCTSLQD
ncbi:hypothetical protein S7711_05760 [Stachybotrys chartarum IBT 7711]|uniref:2EXR domain-containing protein n=1 Tax=Stachybotrys chartarum (strain CBS 109288 / IBT 7711) TaxID=1280523 RepID=A0A084ATE5_STACB|nr:hypothetical protein S7711_05760 [Stachybotrys chartarum IBT 7711]